MIDKLRNLTLTLTLVIEISVMYVYERRFLAGFILGLVIGYFL